MWILSLSLLALLHSSGAMNAPRSGSGVPRAMAGAFQQVRYQSAHIILTAPPGESIDRLLSELESAYRHVQGYGLSLPGKIDVRSHGSTSEFVTVSGGKSYNLAMANGEKIELQPVSLLLRRGDLSRALRHELTHVSLLRSARRGLPRWMNEGLALNVAAEKHPERVKFRRLAELDDALLNAKTYDRLRSAYGASERLVANLIAALGKGKVLGLVRGVTSAEDFSRRFVAATGRTPDQWGEERLRGK